MNRVFVHMDRARCYFDVDRFPGVMNHVALTIDDVPCRLGPRNSMSFGVENSLSGPTGPKKGTADRMSWDDAKGGDDFM